MITSVLDTTKNNHQKILKINKQLQSSYIMSWNSGRNLSNKILQPKKNRRMEGFRGVLQRRINFSQNFHQKRRLLPNRKVSMAEIIFPHSSASSNFF